MDDSNKTQWWLEMILDLVVDDSRLILIIVLLQILWYIVKTQDSHLIKYDNISYFTKGTN